MLHWTNSNLKRTTLHISENYLIIPPRRITPLIRASKIK